MIPSDAARAGGNGWLVMAIAIALCALTVGLRLGMVQGTVVDTPLRADAGNYYSVAYNLRRFGVVSTAVPNGGEAAPLADAQRAPGYPLFILPFVTYPPTAGMVQGIVVTQAMLGGLTVLLVFALLRPLLPLPFAAAAAFLTAISPHLIAADAFLLTESLFTFCVALFIWTLSRLARDPGRLWAIAAGAALGVTVLVRETTTYLPFLLALGLFTVFPRRRALALVPFLLLGYALVYGPWFARNHLNPDIAHGSTHALQSFLSGAYPGLMYEDDPISRGMPHRYDPRYAEIDTWEELIRELWARVEREPLRYLNWYLVGKPTMLLSWSYVAGWGDVYVYPVLTSPYFTDPLFMALHRGMRWLHTPLILLSLAGTLLVWMPSARDGMPAARLAYARMISLVILYFLLLHLVVTPLPRYATPFRPLLFGMAMLASWGLVETWRRERSRSRTGGQGAAVAGR